MQSLFDDVIAILEVCPAANTPDEPGYHHEMRQKIENKIYTEQNISTELLKVDHFKMDQIIKSNTPQLQYSFIVYIYP